MRRKWLVMLLAVLFFCAACAVPAVQTEEPDQGGYTLYFVSNESRADGTVLTAEERELPPDTERLRGLLELLLSGPETPGLSSPFPAGTTLRGVWVEEGTAYVDFSEAYGGLTGMDLTLADGCVVFTLCQLEGVEAVYLTVEGRPRPFRDQVLTPADFLTGNVFPQEAPRETEAAEEDGETWEEGQSQEPQEPRETEPAE